MDRPTYCKRPSSSFQAAWESKIRQSKVTCIMAKHTLKLVIYTILRQIFSVLILGALLGMTFYLLINQVYLDLFFSSVARLAPELLAYIIPIRICVSLCSFTAVVAICNLSCLLLCVIVHGWPHCWGLIKLNNLLSSNDRRPFNCINLIVKPEVKHIDKHYLDHLEECSPSERAVKWLSAKVINILWKYVLLD